MRRIQRDVCHEELVKRLTASETGLFGEIWRLMLFAAALGARLGNRRALAKVDSGKAMPESYFSTPGWKGFLYLLGICDTGSSDSLRSTPEQEDLLVTLFEEYANAGLFFIQDRLASSVAPLDELTSLLLESEVCGVNAPDIDDLI